MCLTVRISQGPLGRSGTGRPQGHRVRACLLGLRQDLHPLRELILRLGRGRWARGYLDCVKLFEAVGTYITYVYVRT